MLRAIYVFHRDVNGWNDIGYNFVDRPVRAGLRGARGRHRRAGRGRPRGRLQPRLDRRRRARLLLGHADLPPRRRETLERLLAWKLSLHGVPARGRVIVRVNPAGRRVQQLPRPRPRLAAADRRPPRRRQHRLPRQRALRRAAGRSRRRRWRSPGNRRRDARASQPGAGRRRPPPRRRSPSAGARGAVPADDADAARRHARRRRADHPAGTHRRPPRRDRHPHGPRRRHDRRRRALPAAGDASRPARRTALSAAGALPRRAQAEARPSRRLVRVAPVPAAVSPPAATPPSG